ncbi:hypothetical protein [Enterobacter sp. ENT03]|uniref:hypothetical protein n=1 Tax=Enterobacter sp. ENT03 TaxID=2854780 RepID=UPI001C48D225|nr:hypothetical protein [Enterobacter sp. ENT03]MBV7403152.1 hypothetical protein [Enterobacter sp. ENT03]
MQKTSSTVIKEEQTGGHAPWISPGTTGIVTFSVQTSTTVSSGDRIHFLSPTGTSLVNASISDLSSSYYTFTLSDDHRTGNLTLTKAITSWGSCELSLAVDSEAVSGITMDDGIARYFMADGQQMGNDASISVIAATVTITEQQTDGHIPWIFPGMSGAIPFSVVADSPDGKGSYLYFTAPTYTDPATKTISHNATITGGTLSDPNLADKYTFTPENNGLNARLTLTADDVTWSECVMTLAVDSSMPKFGTLDNGKVQYTRSDGQPVGASASVTVIAASSNHWDNVASVKSCLIGMQSDDTTSTNKGTLFMNGENDEYNTFGAHSIPVFVGITFKRFSDNFDEPTNDEVLTALSLVGLGTDGETIIDISDNFALTTNIDYRNAYYKTTTTFPLPDLSPSSGAYDHELNLGAWCPKYHTDPIPGNINVYIHLEAPLSTGTYKYTSNGEMPANVSVNFISRKKYQYSDTAGSSAYILVSKETASDEILFKSSNEVRDVGTIHERVIYRVYIDSTPEQSKYSFKFNKLLWIHFLYPEVDGSYTSYGSHIYSAYIKGMAIHGKPQWATYAQHILLPDYTYTAQRPLTEAFFIELGHKIGPVGTHEKNGWACAGTLSVIGDTAEDGITINPGEIAFAAVNIAFESSSTDVIWDKNNHPDDTGKSPIGLVDNFGNHIFLVPIFGTDDVNPKEETSMTLTVEEQ